MNPQPVGQLITFSGIDGAGKSTQIAALYEALSARKFKVATVAFWEDAAILPYLRAGSSFRILRSKPEPEHSIALRHDKNVRAWYLTLLRAGFYALDALNLRRVVGRLQRSGAHFIILDRCSYDQLVHIRARHWLARVFIRMVIKMSPLPTVAFMLDASPEAAFQRKPEYPLAFMHEYREAFLSLREFVPKLNIIAPGSVEEVHRQILSCVLANQEVRSSAAASLGNEHRVLLSNSQ